MTAAIDHIDHLAFVEALEASVLDRPAEAPSSFRRAAAARTVGGVAMEAPFDALALQIGADATRVTDAQVAAVVAKLGERAAFELIAAAATGAGLHRWRRGFAILNEALAEMPDAPA